jgi:transposase
MLRLEKVSDIAILRQAALLLDQENAKLIQKNLQLTRENLSLKGEPQTSLALKLEALEQQLARQNQKLFGDSSERRSMKTAGETPAKPQTGHGPREQPGLPLVEEIHELDVPDQACPKCGGQLKEWAGQFEESDEVDSVRRSFFVRRHKRKKYRCGCGGCVETALGSPKLTPGGRYSPDFACEVAVTKYLDHLPLERQVRIMGREGLVIDSQTLWDQINALARHLAPVKNALHRYVLSHPVIGADETHWKLMGCNESGDTVNKRWQVWTAAAPDAVSYQIEDSRSIIAAEHLLGGYRGVVMADGYGAYQGLRKRGGAFTLAHCWAHVRRKFVEIEEFFPKEANEALDLIGNLYEIERLCPTGPPGDEMRQRLRHERSREVVARIQAWLLGVRTLPKSGLGQAVGYASGLWPGLTRFLDDPRIPLDNNATERAIRGVVIGRKNHYGSRSKRGTEVAALFYSLCETAKLNHLDPSVYLRGAIRSALRGEQVLLPHELVAQATAPAQAA